MARMILSRRPPANRRALPPVPPVELTARAPSLMAAEVYLATWRAQAYATQDAANSTCIRGSTILPKLAIRATITATGLVRAPAALRAPQLAQPVGEAYGDTALT